MYDQYAVDFSIFPSQSNLESQWYQNFSFTIQRQLVNLHWIKQGRLAEIYHTMYIVHGDIYCGYACPIISKLYQPWVLCSSASQLQGTAYVYYYGIPSLPLYKKQH